MCGNRSDKAMNLHLKIFGSNGCLYLGWVSGECPSRSQKTTLEVYFKLYQTHSKYQVYLICTNSVFCHIYSICMCVCAYFSAPIPGLSQDNIDINKPYSRAGSWGDDRCWSAPGFKLRCHVWNWEWQWNKEARRRQTWRNKYKNRQKGFVFVWLYKCRWQHITEHFKDLLRTKSSPHHVLVITINVIAQLLC